MKSFEAPQPLALAVAVLIGIVSLGATTWALWAVARPKDYTERLAAVEQTIAGIEKQSPAAQAQGFGEATLCDGPVVTAAGALRTSLVGRAGASGMVIKALDVAPAVGGPRLSPIDVSFSAEGPYEGAVRLIGALQASSPEVFVDSVQLTPTAGATRLKVRGRAFCWTSARR